MKTRLCSCGAELTELTGRKVTGNVCVAVYRCMICEAFRTILDPPPPCWVSAVARHVAGLHADIIHESYTPAEPS
jgi:hypothetical protein